MLSGSCALSRRTLGGLAANSGKDLVVYDSQASRPLCPLSWTGRLSDVYTLIHEIGHFWSIHRWVITKVTSTPMSKPTMLRPHQPSMVLLGTWNTSLTIRVKNVSLLPRLTDTAMVSPPLGSNLQRKVYTLIEEGRPLEQTQAQQHIMKEVLTDF